MSFYERKENYKKTHRPKLCHVCLSSDRQLLSVEKYGDILLKICDNIQLPSPLLLCWECTAILKKIKQFRERVELSNKVLKKNLNKNTHHYESLSSLKITENESIHIIEYTENEGLDKVKSEITASNNNENCQYITNNEIEDNKYINEIVKQEIDIADDILNDMDTFENNYSYFDNMNKQEIDIADDIINDVDTFESNDSYFDDMKRQSPIINKNNKQKLINKQYRIISHPDTDVRGEMRLNTEEVQFFMSNERLSDLYKDFSYKCDLCVCGWKSAKKLQQHNSRYHDMSAGKFQCDICLSRFRKKKDLIPHLRRHFIILECSNCSYRSFRHLMLRHLKTHDKKIECLKCNARFCNVYSFRKHHKNLHVIFICDLCGKKARSKKILEKHMRHHYEIYECKLCDRRYKNRASFKRHNDEIHSRSDEAYCVPCDKKFKSESGYRYHINRSTLHANETGESGPKKFKCSVCDRVYSRKIYMTNHYRHVHMKESKYNCEQCNKNFLNRTRLLEHVRYKHEGLKKKKNKLCNICGRGFAENRILVNHIRTHSGERPFECEHCGAKFTQKYAMISHVNYVHLKNKRPTWKR